MKLLLFCAFLLPVISFSQQCDEILKVNVVDAHTGTFVPYAKIYIDGQKEHHTTDSLGNFTFTGLCTGGLVLTCIPHFGCEPVEQIIELPYAGAFVFKVEVHAEELDEAIVSAYRFRRESLAKMQVNTLDISRISGSTLGQQLQRIPGVSTLNTGSNIVKPIINGLHSNRIVTVNNGIRQEGQQWGSEHAPEIDPNLARTLEVIQGANGIQYGPDAIGGVIIVEPEELRYGKPAAGWVKAAGFSNGLGGNAAALLNGSLTKGGKIGFRVHASGKMNGTLATPDYLLKNTAASEYSFSGALGYKTTRLEAEVFYSNFTTNLGIFTGSHIGNLTDLLAAFEGNEPKEKGTFTYAINDPKQFIRHQLSRAKLVYDWNEKIRTTVIAGYQFNLRQEYDNHKSYSDSIEALNLPDFELNLWTTTIDLRTEIAHNKRYTSKFGVSVFRQSNAYSGRFFIPNFQKNQDGAYYLGVYSGNLWQLEGGARWDISDLNVYMIENNVLVTPKHRFSNGSYSAGASRILGHHWLVRANAGAAWRPPSVNELYSNGLHHGAASIEEGDRDLKAEKSYQFQAGVQYRSSFANIGLTGFYNYMQDFILLKPSLPVQLTVVGAFPVFRNVQSDAVLSGINLLADIPLGKRFVYTFQGSLLNAVDTEDKKLLFGIPYNRMTNRLRYDQSFKKENKSWFAEMEVFTTFSPTRGLLPADYVLPPNGYTILNASAGLLFKNKNGDDAQIVLSVSNLTNTVYRDYLNRFRYFADETGRNISIRVLVPFTFNSKKESLKN